MREYRINAYQVRWIIDRGIQAPEAADAGGWPRFSYRAMIDGHWVKVVIAMEAERVVVITIIMLG